ncbi:GNAT family N-acetyltransferase [Paeniglutamicibacter sp. MACA_103]|uniref:GNAT family N-acetyltransferase n=1 Tax=Paeniglutamicibacter sp. MACA_103 TaxID=3377337 RepID=UPI003893F40B
MDEIKDCLSLRSLLAADAPSIAGWARDPEFCREAGWSVDLGHRAHLEFQERIISSPPPELVRLGAVVAGVLVGYVDMHGSEPGTRELGFLIGERSRWGRGLGRQAAAAGLDYGFGEMGLEVIWAEVLERNARSMSILRGLDFTETGTGGEGEFMGEPSVYRRFALDAADWASHDGR